MSTEQPMSAPAVDPQNPWLGLASFTEETRAFFHGRDEEVAELGRRVQRKLLTILFGQSGHGKTSLLRAGLVPRLRPQGFCPVYVRLDHTPGSPPPTEQIKQAVLRATAEAGTWTQSGAAVAGESLWEFLHHRDDVLKDAAGRTLTPLLIFDQFEEIFTLAQTDATGRARAQAFLADLADLVENRPPAALEARIESDETDAARFDFTRADYRILITLREDYLPHLEGLKNAMPSVTQNRVRLARMTGAEALDAVLKPGAGLVTADVARSIVLFVSGATDLAHAEVEPSLLSLVCRELNETRRARGHATISADLLAGSRETILTEFYERTLAGAAPGVRRFIEDELLTDSGYRESIAEERVKKAFAAAGAPPESLATLVDRRLLRVEERLDVRRVELTHDVLCGVVAASRTARRERELQEAAEAQLVATRAKEAATRRALFRARLVASVCAVLAAAAVYGFWETRKARTRAEKLATIADQSRATAVAAQAQTAEARNKAEAERKLADTTRGQAEALANILLVDIYDELEPTARYDTIARLAERVVAYYDGLPAVLRSTQTERRRALALTRQGAALRGQGKFDAGDVLLDQSVAAFEKLVASGDKSNGTAQGLAIALLNQTSTAHLRYDSAALLNTDRRAVELLRPLAAAPNSSARVRKEYARALRYLSFDQVEPEAQLKLLDEARRVLAGAGASDLSDLFSAAAYAACTRNASSLLTTLKRDDEAERYRNEALSMVERVLAQHPGVLLALSTRASLEGDLSTVEAARFHFAAALELAFKSEQTCEEYLRFNPADSDGWYRLVVARGGVANLLAQRGRIHDAIEKNRSAVNVAREQKSSAEGIVAVPGAALIVADLEAQLGHREAAGQAVADGLRFRRELARERRTPEVENEAWMIGYYGPRARSLLWSAGDFVAVITQARQEVEQSARLLAQPQLTEYSRTRLEAERQNAPRDAAMANVMLGHYAEAEASLRQQLSSSKAPDPNRRAWLALAIARQNRGAEALEILAPVLVSNRDRQAKGDDSLTQQQNLVRTLYIQAIAQPGDEAGRAQRRASLDEAAKILDSFTDDAKQLAETRLLQNWIAAERAK